eukprot:scaffold123501_cov60-Phaeocystis_antarctica.AAC.1
MRYSGCSHEETWTPPPSSLSAPSSSAYTSNVRAAKARSPSRARTAACAALVRRNRSAAGMSSAAAIAHARPRVSQGATSSTAP